MNTSSDIKEYLYVPGTWRCPKCGFTLTMSVMHVESGNVGVDLAVPTEPCPNDGRDLQPVTWKERCAELAAMCEQQMKRAADAESALERLSRQVEKRMHAVAEQLRKAAGIAVAPSAEYDVAEYDVETRLASPETRLATPGADAIVIAIVSTVIGAGLVLFGIWINRL